MFKKLKYWLLVCSIMFCTLIGTVIHAQEGLFADTNKDSGTSSTKSAASPGRLKFNGAPGTRDLILEDYAEKTGRTLLLDPKLPQANIVLNSQTELTIDEYLEAIERSLRMHGIALVPVGEKFLKVVPVVGNRPMQEDLKIKEGMDGKPLPERGKLVSQMVTLSHIEIPEALKAVTPFKHSYGLLHPLERSNSILITDTAAAINKMIQIIKHIDQQIEAREEPNVVQINFAKATEIKTKLEEIIAESQAEQKKSATTIKTKKSGSPGFSRSNIPGVIRAAKPTITASTPETAAQLAAEAERGVIRGKVQIIADDRTNVLIIITRPENMKFFTRIIQVLDVETSPDVEVRVFRLEYAKADTVAKMLNDLISGKSSRKDEPAVKGAKKAATGAAARLSDYVKKSGESGAVGESKLGELSADNIKILANERTNALVIMASKGDLQTLDKVIEDMDIILSQVLIEAVILEVGLDDDVQTGVDWVQRAMVAYDQRNRSAGKEALFGFAGMGGGGGANPANTLALKKTSDLLSSGHGLTYYFTHFGLNLDVILNMSSKDSRTQILSSPVIVTHDNTEAKISSSKEAYFFKGKRWVSTGTTSGTYEDDVESRKISLTLTVTPHINAKKNVLMEIVQQIEELGPLQDIGGTKWPTMNSREMKASISVKDRETIVLGGLVKSDKSKTNSGVPFLRKIPIAGAAFRSKSDTTSRSEVIVFITPYVLDTPEQIREESERRQKALINAGKLWEKGWSDSHLARPSKKQLNEEEIKRKKAKKEPKKVSSSNLQERREALLAELRKLEEKEKVLAASSASIVKDDEGPMAVDDTPPEEPANIEEKDPIHDLDPELIKFINSQEKKYGRKMDKIDQKINKEISE